MSVLLRFTDSDYPKPVYVCSSSIYGFWLPQTCICLFFFDLRILITPNLYISVLLRFTDSDYPKPVYVCSSSIYGFWLPQTCICLFFFDLRILITYLVSSNSSYNTNYYRGSSSVNITKGQTRIYKILHRKLKNEQHEP
jgi:hypothetical protein